MRSARKSEKTCELRSAGAVNIPKTDRRDNLNKAHRGAGGPIHATVVGVSSNDMRLVGLRQRLSKRIDGDRRASITMRIDGLARFDFPLVGYRPSHPPSGKTIVFVEETFSCGVSVGPTSAIFLSFNKAPNSRLILRWLVNAH